MTRILQLLNIRRYELRKTLLCFALMFFGFLYTSVQQIIAQAVLNARVGVDMLPIMYIAIAFGFILSSTLLAQAGKNHYTVFFVTAILLNLLNTWILYEESLPPPFYLVVFLTSGVVGIVSWQIGLLMIQETVDLDSNKRILPIALSGGVIGSICGASLLSLLQPFVPTSLFFGLSVIALLMMALISNILLSSCRILRKKGDKPATLPQGLKYIRDSRFYPVLIVLGIFLISAYWMNDFQFNYQIESMLKDEDRIIEYLGKVEIWANLSLLILNLFLLSRLVLWLGSLRVIYLLLITTLIASFLMFSEGHLVIVTLSKLLFAVLVYETSGTLFQILYQPIPQKFQKAATLFLQSLINSGGIFSAGIIAGLSALGLIQHSLLNILTLVAGGVVFILWIKRNKSFLDTLKGNLKNFDPNDIRKLFGSNAHLEFLKEMETDAEKGMVVGNELVIDLLKNADFPEKEAWIIKILPHSDISFTLKLIDSIFEGFFSFELFKVLLTDERERVVEYLIDKTFLHYSNIKLDIELHHLVKTRLRPPNPTEDKWGIYTLSYNYILNEDNSLYQRVLESLYEKGEDSDLLKMLNIIDCHREQASVNQVFLHEILEQYSENTEILKRYPTLGVFREDPFYFEHLSMRFYRYEVLHSFKHPLPEYRKRIEQKPDLLAQLYTLRLSMLEKDSPPLWDRISNLLKCLLSVLLESRKIALAAYRDSLLILDEIESLRLSTLSVILEAIFALCDYTAIEDVYEFLKEGENLDYLLEILQNLTNQDTYAIIEQLILKKDKPENTPPRYEVLKIGLYGETLYQIYRYLGGETMDESLKNRFEKLFTLKKIPMFSELDIQNLLRISDISQTVSYEKGSTIIREGEESDKFYVIVSGSVTVSRKGKRLATLSEGNLFGELAAIDKLVRTASVKVDEPTTCLSFDGDDFVKLLKKNASISFSVVRVLSQRLRNTVENKDQSVSTPTK